MLYALFQNNFNSERTFEQTLKQFEKLKPFDGNKLFSPEGLEVIPYDDLWVMIIEKLKNKNAG